MARYEDLTDEQWAVVEPLLPELRKRKDGRGRPWRSNREVINGILWILRSGARWCDMPERYPSYPTCYRRFANWCKSGVLRGVLEALVADLQNRGKIDLEECFVDATCVGAKKGVPKSVKVAVERAPRSWQWQTLMVFQSPFTHEVLRQVKSPLFTKLSNKVFLPTVQDDLLLTALTTVISLLDRSPNKGFS